MMRGKERTQWWHTASIMALIANCHRDSKKHPRAYTAKHFHPDHCRNSGSGMLLDKDTMGVFVASYVSPEKAAAAEARLKSDQETARKLAAAQRRKLRIAG